MHNVSCNMTKTIKKQPRRITSEEIDASKYATPPAKKKPKISEIQDLTVDDDDYDYPTIPFTPTSSSSRAASSSTGGGSSSAASSRGGESSSAASSSGRGGGFLLIDEENEEDPNIFHYDN